MKIAIVGFIVALTAACNGKNETHKNAMQEGGVDVLDGSIDESDAQVVPTDGAQCEKTALVCDEMDNDCDGEIDEENECSTCSQTDPACDDVDNDCDDQVDEEDECPLCVQSEPACDDMDNDCDGDIDEPDECSMCEPSEPACDDIDNDCDDEIDEPDECQPEFTETYFRLPKEGGEGGRINTMRCPDQQVVVGYDIRPAGNVRRTIHYLALRCASLDAVISGTAESGEVIDQAGTRGETSLYTDVCPRNTAATGLSGRSSDEVNALSLRCTQFSFEGQADEHHATQMRGGEGGEMFEHHCPDDYVLVGLNVRAAWRIDLVEGICRLIEFP